MWCAPCGKGHPAITPGNKIYFDRSPRAFDNVSYFAQLAQEMTPVRKFQAEVRAYTVNSAIDGMMADTRLDSMERAGMRRSFVFAIMPVSLIAGCSPVARIDVDVRSRADIAFDVTVDSKPSACIDSLLIRGADGVVRWEVTRAPDRRNCVQRITFPHLPQGYASRSTIGTLPGGSYAVEVEAGIHRGITRFAVR